MSEISVHVVVALMAEAWPLIDAWGLERVESSPFRIFGSGSKRLVVSGIGKERAGEAVRRLATLSGGPVSVWLNLGICGHPEIPVGRARAVHKVVDDASGEAWYPPAAIPWPWPSIQIRTVEEPELEYPKDAGYDMEASAFVPAARLHATAELVQVVKIVSDNRHSSPASLGPRQVADLVRPRAGEIDGYVRRLRELAAETTPEAVDERLLELLLARAHFTVTRRRQLRDLLRKAAALDLGFDLEDLGQDADEIVEALRNRLASTPRLL